MHYYFVPQYDIFQIIISFNCNEMQQRVFTYWTLFIFKQQFKVKRLNLNRNQVKIKYQIQIKLKLNIKFNLSLKTSLQTAKVGLTHEKLIVADFRKVHLNVPYRLLI